MKTINLYPESDQFNAAALFVIGATEPFYPPTAFSPFRMTDSAGPAFHRAVEDSKPSPPRRQRPGATVLASTSRCRTRSSPSSR